MAETTNLRRLRLRYGIFLTDLEKITGICNQYISRAELGQAHGTARLEEQMAAAIETVITQRKQELLALEADFRTYRGRLLEPAEDKSHE